MVHAQETDGHAITPGFLYYVCGSVFVEQVHTRGIKAKPKKKNLSKYPLAERNQEPVVKFPTVCDRGYVPAWRSRGRRWMRVRDAMR